MADSPPAGIPHADILVAGLIVLRGVLGLFFAATLIHGMPAWAFGSLSLAALTDALDGRVARAARRRALLGPYADPAADTLFVSLAFATFAVLGVHPWWLLGVILAMACQFVLTSGRAGPVYDPLGKYYGVALFAAIGLSLLWPRPAALRAIRDAILAMTVLALGSRGHMLIRRRAPTRAPGRSNGARATQPN